MPLAIPSDQEVPGVRSLNRSLGISVALHMLVFLVCAVLISKRSAITPKEYTYIEVEPVTATEALKKAQDDLKTKNQIVQTEKVKRADVAAKNAFLGEQTQTVDRETVSRSRNTVMEHTGEIAKKQTNPEKAEAKSESKDKSAQQVVKAPSLGDLAVPMIPKYAPQSQTKREEQAKNDNWADQGSSPQDYVHGYKESDRTALNTKEFLFYGYYQRIRARLDSAWVPILRSKLVRYYNSGRHLASDMEHETKVVVILNKGGDVVQVKLVSESGTRDLDDAAIDAFNQAGPFPNPPKGIANASGVIEIPWEFVLHT
jgi:TonB family protein